jgi:hypothetical protein
MAGSYQVVARNFLDSTTSATVTLTVNAAPPPPPPVPATPSAPPAITTQPSAVEVAEGRANHVARWPRPGSGPLTFQWRKNGAVIAGASGAEFTLADAKPGDSGSYAVVVSNQVGSATSVAASVVVNPAAMAPLIVTQRPAFPRSTGARVSLNVTARGTAPLSFEWRKKRHADRGRDGRASSRLAAFSRRTSARTR